MADSTPKHLDPDPAPEFVPDFAPDLAAEAPPAAAAEGHRVSLVKGPHRWVFRWSAGDEAALIARVAELARDPEADFDWFDAAVVCKHVAPRVSTDSPRSGASDQN